VQPRGAPGESRPVDFTLRPQGWMGVVESPTPVDFFSRGRQRIPRHSKRGDETGQNNFQGKCSPGARPHVNAGSVLADPRACCNVVPGPNAVRGGMGQTSGRGRPEARPELAKGRSRNGSARGSRASFKAKPLPASCRKKGLPFGVASDVVACSAPRFRGRGRNRPGRNFATSLPAPIAPDRDGRRSHSSSANARSRRR